MLSSAEIVPCAVQSINVYFLSIDSNISKLGSADSHCVHPRAHHLSVCLLFTWFFSQPASRRCSSCRCWMLLAPASYLLVSLIACSIRAVFRVGLLLRNGGMHVCFSWTRKAFRPSARPPARRLVICAFSHPFSSDRFFSPPPGTVGRCRWLPATEPLRASESFSCCIRPQLPATGDLVVWLALGFSTFSVSLDAALPVRSSVSKLVFSLHFSAFTTTSTRFQSSCLGHTYSSNVEITRLGSSDTRCANSETYKSGF